MGVATIGDGIIRFAIKTNNSGSTERGSFEKTGEKLLDVQEKCWTVYRLITNVQIWAIVHMHTPRSIFVWSDMTKGTETIPV